MKLFGVVLLNPGEQGLGIAGDSIAEGGLLGLGQGILEQLDARREQELEGGVGEVAQHGAELAARGDAGGDIETVRRGRVENAGEAEAVDQGGMLDSACPPGA
ncbi:MAG: hypothetical protein HGA65_12775 [Oscillochloris sp.]|nr:hypothetical protein [Oscillochloris sp.]